MYVFIGGPPTAGKTHLVAEFVNQSSLEIFHYKTDDFRKELKNNFKLNKWVNFFRNQDEAEYWNKNTTSDHVNNLIKQSKALWPHILNSINQKIDLHEHIIFEGVSILPVFARKDLNFPGFYLIPNSQETIFTRLLGHARWGETNALKRKEARAFYEGDARYYSRSAKENGYKVFDNYEDALSELAHYFYN